MKLLLLRNAEHMLSSEYVWPSNDTELSERGNLQAIDIAKKLESVPIAAIYSSIHVRAVKTVTPLARRKGLSIKKTQAFNALSIGDCVGATHEETCRRIGGEAWNELFTNPDPHRRYFTNGETLKDMSNRAMTKLDNIGASYARKGDVVVISTHEEIIGALLCRMMDIDLSRIWWWGGRRHGSPLYGSITEITQDDNRWHLIRFGCTEHLRRG